MTFYFKAIFFQGNEAVRDIPQPELQVQYVSNVFFARAFLGEEVRPAGQPAVFISIGFSKLSNTDKCSASFQLNRF